MNLAVRIFLDRVEYSIDGFIDLWSVSCFYIKWQTSAACFWQKKMNMSLKRYKGKVCHTPTGVVGVHLLTKAVSPLVVIPLLSVTHGQCDARPTVTFPAYDGTKFILLGDSWVYMISRPDRIRTRAGTANQASVHVLISVTIAHATTRLSRQTWVQQTVYPGRRFSAGFDRRTIASRITMLF